MGPEHSITVSLEWMEHLRGLMLFGWMALFTWFAGTLMHEAGMLSPHQKPAAEFCKLHSCPLSECPPGSHDPS